MSLRLVFMGTPDFAVPTLHAVQAAGHDVVAAYTRAPRPAGRGLAERKSPVHVSAEAAGIPVLMPTTLSDADAAAAMQAHGADAAVVVAYGMILPQAVLDAPRLGCFNLHASLLPRWRGAAPINRAIMAGDAETGVAVMRMDAGLDTGDVGAVAATPIDADETAGELHDRLSTLGASLIAGALSAIESGTAVFTPQSETGVEYAAKLSNAETRIDWSLSAQRVHDHIRGLSPFPGAWTHVDLGRGRERLKILKAEIADGQGAPGTVLDEAGLIACGEGALRLVTVQRAGKGAMAFADFARGSRLASGTVLGRAAL